MQCLQVQSSSTFLRSVVVRNLKMQHLRNKGVMFLKLHTQYTHFDVCSVFMILAYISERGQSVPREASVTV